MSPNTGKAKGDSSMWYRVRSNWHPASEPVVHEGTGEQIWDASLTQLGKGLIMHVWSSHVFQWFVHDFRDNIQNIENKIDQ